MGHAVSSSHKDSTPSQGDSKKHSTPSGSIRWLREVVDNRLAETSSSTEKPLQYFDSTLISRSWLDILSSAKYGEDGSVQVHGMTLFQNCFFEKLRAMDIDGLIFKKLCKCQSSASASHKTPGHLLMIIVRYISTQDCTCRSNIKRLEALGRTHQRMNIPRSQLETFRDALLLTIECRLAVKSSSKVVTAWRMVTQFCVDSMYNTTYQFYSVRSSFSLISSGSDGNMDTMRTRQVSDDYCDHGVLQCYVSNKDETEMPIRLEKVDLNPESQPETMTGAESIAVRCSNTPSLGNETGTFIRPQQYEIYEIPDERPQKLDPMYCLKSHEERELARMFREELQLT